MSQGNSLGIAPLGAVLRSLKLSHTLFALPFALGGMVLSARGWPQWSLVFWIVGAFTTARGAGMLFNRIVDRHWDRLNPRTSDRDFASGKISPGFGWGVFAFFGVAFVFCCSQINRDALLCSPIVLAILCFYSLTKRFTALCHLFIGLALALSPLAASVAVRGFPIPTEILFLGLAVFFWVAGFDIIYATLDFDFDRSHGLFSLPARLGVPRALALAGVMHALTIVFLSLVNLHSADLDTVFAVGVAFTALLLISVHRRARSQDPAKVNEAFFSINVWVGVCNFATILVDVLYV